MTAEQTDGPRWPRPPEQGYTIDDLLTRDLPPHTELIDGSLVMVPPQRNFHGVMIDHLVQSLRTARPTGLKIRREMVVVLSDQTALEPDVLVLREDRVSGPDQVTFRPADLVLAIEVVSPSSQERDRDTKPHKYAGAGIPHYWRIERESDGRFVAYTFDLDRELSRYRPTGTFINRLITDLPFAVDIDLTEADRL